MNHDAKLLEYAAGLGVEPARVTDLRERPEDDDLECFECGCGRSRHRDAGNQTCRKCRKCSGYLLPFCIEIVAERADAILGILTGLLDEEPEEAAS